MKSPNSFFDLAVPVKLANGASGTTNLATAISDSLFVLTPSAITIDCPLRMGVGSSERVRLTSRENLTDLLRQKLEADGVDVASLMGIVVLIVADLKSTDDAFSVQEETRSDGTSSNAWVWRVEARKPGNHDLEAIVTLSAQIPLRGKVAAKPANITRSIVVEDNPTNAFSDFLNRYAMAIAETMAGLMAGTWLAWMLLRSRRSSFSHR